jgi:type II restriction/modification system DNA methylase subunit YeeA
MLEREYEKSLEILLPIKEQLAKTDRLIDQIVYKLYGLTEEEIDIVEGRG